jgi:4-alpha-glucanotransferase
MIIHFNIHYITVFGENIAVKILQQGQETLVNCQTFDGKYWNGQFQNHAASPFLYKYILLTPNSNTEEYGAWRSADAPKDVKKMLLHDAWRPTQRQDNAFLSAAFKDVIFKRNEAKNAPKATTTKGNQVIFKLQCPKVPQHLRCAIIGNHAALGNWITPQPMSENDFPTWKKAIAIAKNRSHIEYKYVWIDEKDTIVLWEEGENRTLHFDLNDDKTVTAFARTEDDFRLPTTAGKWRGAGVAVPVFSLRSQKGLGIGEFTDLNAMVDWSVATGLKVLQTLPVNDTIATKTWRDSYPYAAISVFALHPLYVNIEALGGTLDKKDKTTFEQVKKKLNELECVDFEEVLHFKFLFFKKIYQQTKEDFWKNKNVEQFIADNGDWLHAYAAFSYLRDKNGTCNFNLWEKHSTFSPTVIEEICNRKAKHFDEVALYYFIQYHAHQQLSAATNYARSKGVILKGDLPIGIYRFSADAWTAPHLYNMNGQAGAPPDAYAEGGQNWGFPTYNWEVMAKDNFAWWRERMTKLAEYFDALRIDHILGFFRIWQIPLTQVEGTLGLFNPRLPMSREELAQAGLYGDLSRFTNPYIHENHLREIFGNEVDFVRTTFLEALPYGFYRMQPQVDTQQKIKALFAESQLLKRKSHLEKPLMRLLGEVILIEEPGSNGAAYNPRITVNTTRSYRELPDHHKRIVDNLYSHYFFGRHDEFWKQQALWKLPALLNATNMFICAEDLGMIPATVPEVMERLNVVTLEIQRMPKGNTAFGQPHTYDYMTVCSPSCHDMATIRGWWDEDYGTAQRFWQHGLWQHGSAPKECHTGIVTDINNQHLYSPSMWAIFPLQDLFGMDEELRRHDSDAEQINEPANPQHYWRFRFHLDTEQMLKENTFNQRLKRMIEGSGR